MKNYDSFSSYPSTLNDEEIINISKIIRDFKDEIITYIEVENLFDKLNITIVPLIVDSSNLKTVKQVSDLRERVENKTLKAQDINGYLISNERCKNVLFRYDRQAIEKLAKHGDERAIKTLEVLKEWENNFPNWQDKRKQEFEEYKTEFNIPKYR